MITIKLTRDEMKQAKIIHQEIVEMIDVLKKNSPGMQVFVNVDEVMKKSIIIMLRNDGYFVEGNEFVIIWDKEKAQEYSKKLSSICSRSCGKNEKSLCTGCVEYKQTSRILANFNRELEITA